MYGILIPCVFLLLPLPVLAQQALLDQVMDSFSSDGDNLTAFLLSRIFGCQLFSHQGCSVQDTPVFVSLIRIFNIFSLSLGGALFGWFLATGVAQTAHEGKVLGARFSSMWAPIRSIVGLGMLVPIDGTDGYNTIQLGIALFVKASTFTATLLWAQASDRILTLQDSYLLPDHGFDASVIEPLWQMSSCSAMLNGFLEGMDSDQVTRSNIVPTQNCHIGENGLEVCSPAFRARVSGNLQVIHANRLGQEGLCGRLDLPSIPPVLTRKGNTTLTDNSLAIRFREVHLDAINSVLAELEPRAAELVSYAKLNPDGGSRDQVYISDLSSAIIRSGTTYTTVLRNGLSPLLASAGVLGSPTDTGTISGNARTRLGLILSGSYSSACRGNVVDQDLAEICNDPGNQGQGWLGAGAWYMHMARFANDGIQVWQARPTFVVPKLEAAAEDAWEDVTGEQRWWLTRLFRPMKATTPEYQAIQDEARNLARQVDGYWQTAWLRTLGSGHEIPLAYIQGAGTGGGSFNGLKERLSRFMWEQLRPDPNSDPMMALAVLGNGLAEIGGSIVATSLGSQIIGSVGIFGGLSGFFDGLGDIFMPIGFAILMIGQTLSSIMPILPSLIWVAAVTGYFLIIAEAIIAVNLWAISHFRMEGEGLAGPAGQQGYLLVLSLALTPVFMVFGFLLGMGIFKITTTLLNMGFYVALDGVTQSQSLFVWLTGLLLIGVVMIVVIFVLAERSFSLTAELPGRILRWIGGNAEILGSETDRIRVATAGAGHQIMNLEQRATETMARNTRGGLQRRFQQQQQQKTAERQETPKPEDGDENPAPVPPQGESRPERD